MKIGQIEKLYALIAENKLGLVTSKAILGMLTVNQHLLTFLNCWVKNQPGINSVPLRRKMSIGESSMD